MRTFMSVMLILASDPVSATCEIILENRSAQKLEFELFDGAASNAKLTAQAKNVSPNDYIEVELPYGCGKQLVFRYKDGPDTDQISIAPQDRILGVWHYEIP